MKNISKILAILSLPLLLTACGGGGGGGGGASGGATSYTVPACADTGNRTAEYNFMGHGNVNQAGYGLSVVCASSAYARGATGSGIKVAILDTGISLNGSNAIDITDLSSQFATFTTGSDVVNSDNIPKDGHGHGFS